MPNKKRSASSSGKQAAAEPAGKRHAAAAARCENSTVGWEKGLRGLPPPPPYEPQHHCA